MCLEPFRSSGSLHPVYDEPLPSPTFNPRPSALELDQDTITRYPTMSQKGSVNGDVIAPAQGSGGSTTDGSKVEHADDSHEIFKRQDGAVDFRTVGWVHASVIFLKRESPTKVSFKTPSLLLESDGTDA